MFRCMNKASCPFTSGQDCLGRSMQKFRQPEIIQANGAPESSHASAAVDIKYDTCDERGVIRSQIQSRIGNIQWITKPT